MISGIDPNYYLPGANGNDMWIGHPYMVGLGRTVRYLVLQGFAP
jgi:hypothetical protein